MIEAVSHFYVKTKEMSSPLYASAFVYRIAVTKCKLTNISCHSHRALRILEQRFVETITKVIRCNPQIIRYVGRRQ